MSTQDPRSDRPTQDAQDTDALAVDAVPDEVRLHGDADETTQSQPTAAGPKPEPDTESEESGPEKRASGDAGG